MKCVKCGCRMQPGVILYRQNPKGEPGIWLCVPCGGKAPDEETQRLCEAIRSGAYEESESEGGE